MYEHAIPQNIMDYEFKLFAGLSVKQFIVLALTGGIAFALVQANRTGLLPDFFAWIIIPIVVIGGVGLGLGSFQKRSFDEWITNYFKAINSPLRRAWKKTADPIKKDQFFNTKLQTFPQYMAVYFLNEDEYRKVTQFSVAPAATATPTVISPTIVLTPDNMGDYADQTIVLPMIPNTIAFRIVQDGIPADGVIVYVKDANGNVITALRSNESGIIYFDQSFQNGIYTFEFQSDTMQLPKFQITFEGGNYPLINVTPLV